jgi:hypothetical protein
MSPVEVQGCIESIALMRELESTWGGGMSLRRLFWIRSGTTTEAGGLQRGFRAIDADFVDPAVDGLLGLTRVRVPVFASARMSFFTGGPALLNAPFSVFGELRPCGLQG